jgi:hypothetical protein
VIGGGSSAGGVAGERRRRHRGNTAVAARSPAREQAELSNVLHTGLRVVGCLGVRARGVVAVSARDVARRDASSCGAGAPAQNSSKYLTLN